jgi:hypothetical protein
MQYPHCVLCVVRGRINQGSLQHNSARQRDLVVDHIVPHQGKTAVFWDEHNWQTLCRYPCHDKVKRSVELSGVQWWDVLRNEMESRGTEELVRAAALPQWVRERLLAEGRVVSLESEPA